MMTYKQLTCLLLLGAWLQGVSCHRNLHAYQPGKQLIKETPAIFRAAGEQYTFLAKHLPADSFPKTYYEAAARWENSGSGWWCSGFYPGTLIYLYEQTGDTALWKEAQRIMKVLQKEQFNKNTHDLGFMMFCSFGNAQRLAPSEENKQILLNSARSLASRYSEKVGAIRSWNSKAGDFLVIVDNMMNLELLFWATKVTGDSSFYRMAVTHANTTLKHHFRPDNSSYHLVNYHPETGAVQQKRTVQGASDSSAWARGQGWGLYGYTVMYRETHDPVYLEQAQKIAGFILDHPNLPSDKIPYWDFNAPGIPNTRRDASAGALIASALIELAGYSEKAAAATYLDAAGAMLRSLASPAYTAPYGENGGFLLRHSVGHLPARSEVDVPLTYADYYYVEALSRYQDPGR
ncbi:MAG TPA: glycoside hydrolase family 88 protein [Chitinophagaceae bacterium]